MERSTHWKDYLTFSKNERIAMIVLLLIIIAAIFLPYLYRKHFEPPVVNYTLQKQLDSSYASDSSSAVADLSSKDVSYNSAGTTGDLFYFDPNALDENGFRKLGLRDKTIQTIIKYRSKGGHFYKPEDLQKIYGLHEDEAARLIPYVRIKGTEQNESIVTKDEVPVEKYKPVYINSATEEEWKALPGIGEVLSKRIVKFRTSMHGFASVDDVARTYGLSDSVFNSIKPYLQMDDYTE